MSRIVLLAALLMGIPEANIQVAGRVLDRAGHPVANARVVYTNEEMGKTYKFKTNKKGEFSGIGVVEGVYQITITGPDGSMLYKTRRRIAGPLTPEVKKDTNFLNADLSIISITDLPAAGVEANVSPGEDKLSEQQKEAIRTHNASVEKMNDLIRQLHAALDAQQWKEAKEILNQLIAAEPNRWEFYQNMGTLENNQSHYEEAAKNYEKAIALAQSGVTTGPQPDKKDISLMMVYAGDAYNNTGNTEKAIDWYRQAAAISPEPATAYFNMCRAYRATGNTESALEACNKAISIDPKRWEFYQTLGVIQENAGQYQTAIETYDKGIQIARNLLASQPDMLSVKTALGQMLSMEGSSYLSLKKFDQAVDAFNRATEFENYPARDFFNICATFYNLDRMEAAAGACDKAITADPRMASAYFVKASALFKQSKLEHGKLTVPAGTKEALDKYLELDPTGGNAAVAREMLAKIGTTIDTTYKPRTR
ncbi:MAG TPA: tetratricopeptide repeat protein [Candidatus Angelobacter sp.]